MPALHCPSCAAPRDDGHPDPLARCDSCGALISAALHDSLLCAQPRVTADRARALVRNAVPQVESSWSTGAASLVHYPFADGGSARRPFRPLAGLPSSIVRHFRPSGADMRLASETSTCGTEGVCVPPTLPAPAGSRTILYPFWRVSLRRSREESAAWCDAIDGQVMLSERLAKDAPKEPARSDGRLAVAAIAGTIVGLAVGFPASLVPLAVAYAVLRTPVPDSDR
ncbi:MAG: hypothetical protein OEQ13_11980 [Acidobacteriota bacterium]|nr:hypothetical protein [Acidobacteriota bacterium]